MKWYDFDIGHESLDECRDRRLRQCPILSGPELEVLRQCRMTIWDGNVVSKCARNSLADKGLIVRWNGWQVITQEGMAVLDTLGEMRDNRWPKVTNSITMRIGGETHLRNRWRGPQPGRSHDD